jgi:ATP-dependent DNA helicase RecG
LRYEDETRITKLRDVREGDTAQIEARVTDCEVSFRPRRQLVVTVDDGTDTCTLRFFNFYPSQQKALAVGNRILVRAARSRAAFWAHHAAPGVSQRGVGFCPRR